MREFSFQHVDVKTELVKALSETLPKKGFTKVKVIKADPQTPAELPCIGINRVDDNESSQSIGDAAGTHYDETTKKHYRYYGTYFQESVEVRIWHTNADERDKLYRAMKAILFAMRTDLVEKGLLNPSLRSGRDEQDSTMAQAPMILYWSSITMSYLNPMDVTFEEVIDPIEVINAHMDTGGA